MCVLVQRCEDGSICTGWLDSQSTRWRAELLRCSLGPSNRIFCLDFREQANAGGANGCGTDSDGQHVARLRFAVAGRDGAQDRPADDQPQEAAIGESRFWVIFRFWQPCEGNNTKQKIYFLLQIRFI